MSDDLTFRTVLSANKVAFERTGSLGDTFRLYLLVREEWNRCDVTTGDVERNTEISLIEISSETPPPSFQTKTVCRDESQISIIVKCIRGSSASNMDVILYDFVGANFGSGEDALKLSLEYDEFSRRNFILNEES